MKIHASAVSLEDKGILIIGKSGSGKSSLALEFLALGAALISDDQVRLTQSDGVLIATAPTAIIGKIEARGVGILAAKPASATPITLCIDMDRQEVARLPEFHTIQFLDVTLPLVFGRENRHLAPAILQYLKADRIS